MVVPTLLCESETDDVAYNNNKNWSLCMVLAQNNYQIMQGGHCH